MTVLVTGGCGFIGANFVMDWLREVGTPIVNVDSLTYAGNPNNLRAIGPDSPYTFVHADIRDRETISSSLHEYRPRAVVHFAAESHVDRSIHGPENFIQTNIVGTFRLVEEVASYWSSLPSRQQEEFRFLHVSTDEVYGSLGPNDPPFSESTAYSPNSPYAASKAASDHLVRAYSHTYGLPVLTSNCSNNYGPFQFPEKLIPLMIVNGLAGKALPIYGDGKNIRDWLYVSDHCSALRAILASGRPGETYNVGGGSEMANLDLVRLLCDLLDELHPDSPVTPHSTLIEFVKDRPGHDRRYAIDADKIRRELNWQPTENLQSGLRRTVDWYLNNLDWIDNVVSGEYRNWVALNYAQRVTPT